MNFIQKHINQRRLNAWIKAERKKLGLDTPLPNDHICFLLGAGFSKPAQYPTVTELNNEITNVRAGDIWIGGGNEVGYVRDIDGGVDVNEMLSRNKRHFFEDFIQFYKNKMLASGGIFQYEDFYDYYFDIMRSRDYDDDYQTFYDSFVAKYGNERDARNIVSDFDKTFIKFLSEILYRYDDVANGKVSRFAHAYYRRFISLMEKLPFIVNIHTLNHDLFIEQLAWTNSMRVKLSDGFVENGSPYYAEPQFANGKKVRVKYFNNEYDTQYRLFKLHGSVDYLPFNFNNQELVMIRTMPRTNVSRYYKEYCNKKKGRLDYFNCWWNYNPNFLSGTRSKTRHYADPYFYEKLFKNFKNNLCKSKHLIMIGYGYWDTEINNYLKKYFLDRKDTTLLCISPNRPQNLPVADNVIHYPVSITDIDLPTIEGHLKIKLA